MFFSAFAGALWSFDKIGGEIMMSSLYAGKLTLESLMKLSLRDAGNYGTFLPLQEEVLEWFRLLEAGWVHGGDPKKPHAKLYSGKCSTGYFLCKKLLKYGNLREILAACIIKKLREAGLDNWNVGGVFGAPYSSITLVADVARLLGVPNYIVEKGPKDEDNNDTMVFKSDDPIPQDTVLLQAEELITTLHSANMARLAIICGNRNRVSFAPSVGALVYRPELINTSKDAIVAVIQREVSASEAPCDLCKQGSRAIEPKFHWAELTA